MGKLKDGWEDRAKREEILGPLEVSVPPPLGQFVASHPLLIPLIAKKVFSNLGKKDLLTVRRVCGEWQILGTETYRDRESIKMNVSNSTPFDPVTIGRFIEVMTSSTMIPIVRFFLRIDLIRIPSPALPQFLAFIAPFVRWIRIDHILHDEVGGALNPDVCVDKYCEALRGLCAMGAEEDGVLRMPCLEEFAFQGGGDTDYHLFQNGVAMQMLALKILDGAEGLQSFGHDYPYEPRKIIRAVPKDLKRLTLSFINRVMFRSPVSDIPYSAFMDPGFHLEELRDLRVKQEGLGLADFLSTQKDSLRRMHVDLLEEVYREAYPNFPQLKSVDKLRCEVNSNSTFEFLRAFPNLIELTIHLMHLKPPVKDKMNDILRDLKYLPQHPSVTKLHIRLTAAFPVPQSSTRTVQELLSFPVLAHCFPNVTHLSTPTGDSPRILTDVFTHFSNLQWLFLDFSCGNPRPRELESVLSGIPVIYCDSLKASGNYEDAAEEDEDADGIGLPNLKRLQTLEVGEDEHRFEFLFSELMFSRVFLKMESLKAICFVKEDKMPEACLPFAERLKDKGIDLFRMKEKEG